MEAHDRRITGPIAIGWRYLKWDGGARDLRASPALSASTTSHPLLAKTIAMKGIHIRWTNTT